MEFLDVVDPATGAVLGQRSRPDVHRDGDWHQVFHCLIVQSVTQRVVLQERDHSKLAFGGKLDLSVTGHLSAGEQPLDGIREAEEELGIIMAPEQLVPLGVRLLADTAGEANNRERIHVFFYPDDRSLTEYRPRRGEVSAVVEIAPAALLELLADPTRRSTVPRWDGVTLHAEHSISAADLVPGNNGYWTILALMAQRFFAGERPLAI